VRKWLWVFCAWKKWTCICSHQSTILHITCCVHRYTGSTRRDNLTID
jgi:hypothetical protein